MSYKLIPLGTPERFNVVLEIPRGSQNKYEYDGALDMIVLDFVFQGDFRFIHNYGYIPQTRAGDGDHLDAFVLTTSPLQIGVVVPCRPIGMIELLDRGEEDNKIIAVPIADPAGGTYQSIRDVSEQHIEEFKNFFDELGIQKNKKIEIVGFRDKDRAIEEIKKCFVHIS